MSIEDIDTALDTFIDIEGALDGRKALPRIGYADTFCFFEIVVQDTLSEKSQKHSNY